MATKSAIVMPHGFVIQVMEREILARLSSWIDNHGRGQPEGAVFDTDFALVDFTGLTRELDERHLVRTVRVERGDRSDLVFRGRYLTHGHWNTREGVFGNRERSAHVELYQLIPTGYVAVTVVAEHGDFGLRSEDKDVLVYDDLPHFEKAISAYPAVLREATLHAVRSAASFEAELSAINVLTIDSSP